MSALSFVREAVVGSDLDRATGRAADVAAQLETARIDLAKEERRGSDAEADLAAGKGDLAALAAQVAAAEEAARPLRRTVAALESAQAAAGADLARERKRSIVESAEKLEASVTAAVEKETAAARKLIRQVRDLMAGDSARAGEVLAARRAAGLDAVAAPAVDLGAIVRELNRELTDKLNHDVVEEHLGVLLVAKNR